MLESEQVARFLSLWVPQGKKKSCYSPSKINSMLNSCSVQGHLDKNIQQFGQIPSILRSLSCQVTFQASTLLSIQKKGLQVQALQKSGHDSLHAYIN